ncbi:MAG: hypothetical protein AB7O90_19765 [Hyphomicrobium sp.]
MARKALVVEATGAIDNIIEIEDGANWPIPSGRILVASATADFVHTYVEGEFVEV